MQWNVARGRKSATEMRTKLLEATSRKFQNALKERKKQKKKKKHSNIYKNNNNKKSKKKFLYIKKNKKKYIINKIKKCRKKQKIPQIFVGRKNMNSALSQHVRFVLATRSQKIGNSLIIFIVMLLAVSKVIGSDQL